MCVFRSLAASALITNRSYVFTHDGRLRRKLENAVFSSTFLYSGNLFCYVVRCHDSTCLNNSTAISFCNWKENSLLQGEAQSAPSSFAFAKSKTSPGFGQSFDQSESPSPTELQSRSNSIRMVATAASGVETCLLRLPCPSAFPPYKSLITVRLCALGAAEPCGLWLMRSGL